MKKITGIIAIAVLLIFIGFGFTYKMVEPDGWDRIVDKVVEQVPVLENIISEKTPAPTKKPQNKPVQNPAPAPTSAPTPSTSPSVSPSPTPEIEVDFENMTYEVYNSLHPSVQQQYFDTYENPMDFIEWYKKGKEEYDKLHPSIEIGEDGEINLGDYIDSEE